MSTRHLLGSVARLVGPDVLQRVEARPTVREPPQKCRAHPWRVQGKQRQRQTTSRGAQLANTLAQLRHSNNNVTCAQGWFV